VLEQLEESNHADSIAPATLRLPSATADHWAYYLGPGSIPGADARARIVRADGPALAFERRVVVQMVVPEGAEDMTDEDALRALIESGYDPLAAQFVLDTLRGRGEGPAVD
jgi:hypothetical protein